MSSLTAKAKPPTRRNEVVERKVQVVSKRDKPRILSWRVGQYQPNRSVKPRDQSDSAPNAPLAEPDVAQLGAWDTHPRPCRQLPNTPIHALPIADSQKIILWKYLHFVAPLAYGTNGRGPFCPHRDIAWKSVMTYTDSAQWMLIDAERLMLNNGTRSRDPVHLFHLRSKAYANISKMLDDPGMRHSDVNLTCILAATATEARFWDQNVVRVHVKGLYSLICQRGGTKSLYNSLASRYNPLYGIGFLLFAELEVSDDQDLEICIEGFFSTIEAIQSRKPLAPGQCWRDRVSKNRVDPDSYQDASRPAYFALHLSQRDSTPIDSILKSLLEPSDAPVTVAQRLARFISLYLLNLLIWDYQDDAEAAEELVQEVSKLLHASTAFDNKGKPVIRIEVLPWYISEAWVKLDSQRFTGKSPRERAVHLTDICIQALKIFSRVTDTSKHRLLEVLASWVIRSFDDSSERKTYKLCYLDKKVLLEMKKEAASSWYEENIQSSATR